MNALEKVVVGIISFISFVCLCSSIGGFKGFLVCLFSGIIFGVAIPLFLDIIIRNLYQKKGIPSNYEISGDSTEEVRKMRKKYRDALEQERKALAFEQALQQFDVSIIDDLMADIKEDLNSNFKFRLHPEIESADPEEEFTFETVRFREYVSVSAEEYKVGHQYWHDGRICYHTVYERSFNDLGYKNRTTDVEMEIIENAIAAFMRYQFMKFNPLAKVMGRKSAVWAEVKKEIRNPKYMPDLK